MAPTPSNSSTLHRAWLRWKSLQLPWRKRFLVGHDLNGNTYWEFRDQLASQRMRRIVQQNRRGGYASDVKVSPQWHQWLRHVRQHPPSQAEQVADVVRLRELKARAALADQAWAMKGKITDTGKASRGAGLGGKRDNTLAAGGVGEARVPAFDAGHGQAMPDKAMERRKNEGHGARRSGNEAERGADDTAATTSTTSTGKQEKDDPWRQARRNPGEEWQPESWGGTPASAREKHR